MKTILKFCCCIFAYGTLALNAMATLGTNQIQQLTGMKGTWNEAEKVVKVSEPREDVKVVVDKWTMPPFMGLTSWASFSERNGGEAMVMGDFALFQDEVNAVLSVALNSGLEVTALHNHFFFDEPKVFFMHINGEGPVEKLAAAVGKMQGKAKEIRKLFRQPKESGPGIVPSNINQISIGPLEKIFGSKGQSKDGMCKFVFGRTTKMAGGDEMGKEMGINSWVAFGSTDRFAAITGDIAARENELQAVLKSLRGNSINVVAIHNHMTGENPRMVFVHYWGKGRAETLAASIKATLNVLSSPEKTQ